MKLTLKEAYLIIERALSDLDQETPLSMQAEDDLEEELQRHDASTLVREYILNHVDTPERILNLDELINYLEGKLDDAQALNRKEWSRGSFVDRERIFASTIGRKDFDLFKRKGWVKDL